MDHIPTPEHPFRVVRVPWLGGGPRFINHREYDLEPSQESLARIRRNSEKLLEEDCESKDSAGVAALLQEWLFFDLLKSIFQICGITFIKSDFVRYTSKLVKRPKKKAFVTTRTLGKRLQQWYDKEKHQPVSIKLDHEKRIRYNFTIVSEVIQLFNRKLRSAGSTDQATYLRNCLPGEVELSIVVLLASIQYFHTIIYDPRRRLKVPQCPWLSLLMVEEGWCAGQITKLWRRHDNVLTMYYIKLLGPPTVKKDHSRCSMKRCAANDVLDDTYVTAHRPLDISFMHAHIPKMITKRMSCKCGGHLGPDMEKLNAIIRDGNIPVISVSCARNLPNGKWDDSLDLQVVAYEPNTPYVAISHVWSDGLGNPKENTLFICQLKALRTQLQHMITVNPEYFDEMFPEGLRMRAARHLERIYFWIDTLCVPVKSRETRKMAIRDMRAVYEKATAVLVKDAELIAQGDRYAPVEELMSRVCVSPWCGRLWTLQEASLNDRVFVQLLHNDVVPLDDLNEPTRSLVLLSDELLEAESLEIPESHSAFRYTEDKIDVATKFMACPSAILSMNVLPPSLMLNPVSIQTKAELLLQILTEVRSRETSKASDEAICLATLLNEGSEAVLRENDADRRWTAFLSIIGDVISPTILFANFPKMTLTGYRWAPRTFLKSVDGSELSRAVNADGFDRGMHNLGEESDSDSDEPAGRTRDTTPSVQISDLGLMASFSGFTFRPLSNPLSPEFRFSEDSGETTYCCISEYAHEHFGACFDGSPLLPEDSWNAVKPGPNSQISIVLEGRFSDSCAPVRGALLTNCCNKFNIWYGTYVCLVLIIRVMRGHTLPDYDWMKENRFRSPNKSQWELVLDTKYGAQQQWCVG
ncbi:uncharacterized protein Z518_06586 [Rhinocladiella mackenziei CBS 650.93]|uniref:Heterokaryon incompatibility domain-containing protein n=1 Tax=Rhinocladiella mackenziei CBS 650.93 TaxID=1442369 RepID=A0A0D2IID6_9EURO|nr:uncharacterized protein Z518_06586 [Rhinocladiella mackenziei CBS 650.93]KIX03036.1 hypothetical protein Z518_06586 [Rhinocladiella mackenziei CBS 650.93]